jgi:predicted Zn-dependent protease
MLLLLASGCASTSIAPIGSESLEEDERYIWKRSLEMQQKLDRSGLLYEDADLAAYVNDVADRVVGEEFATAGMKPQVRILSDVDMNAFSLATGVVYLHTAMLARMDNEAQLAALLGHEFSHIIYRHALRGHRDLKNKTAFMSTVVVLASAAPYGAFANLLLQLGSVSSIFGYSRGLEREADAEGLNLAARAGYDVDEAPKIFRILLDYQRELEEQGIEEDRPPYFFSTHPRLKERIESYRELIEERYSDGTSNRSGILNQEVFAARVEGATLRQATLEVDAGRHRSARVTVERVLAHDPLHAEAWFTLGEALQGSENDDERHAAVVAFRQALAFEPDLARAHRALGMALYCDREVDEIPSEEAATALSHFERYLELEPDATDRGYVDSYIGKLRSVVPVATVEEEIQP